MSRRPRRNHASAFKAKVALAAIKGDQPNIEWKDQLLEGATSAFPTSSGTKPSTPEVDIKALHAKIGELTLRKNPSPPRFST